MTCASLPVDTGFSVDFDATSGIPKGAVVAGDTVVVVVGLVIACSVVVNVVVATSKEATTAQTFARFHSK